MQEKEKGKKKICSKESLSQFLLTLQSPEKYQNLFFSFSPFLKIMVKTHKSTLNNSVHSTVFLAVSTVLYNRCLGPFHLPNCNFIPLNNNSFPSALSPWQPLLPALYVSTLFRSQRGGCVITSLLHLPAQFRSASFCATLSLLGFHDTEPPNPLLCPLRHFS